MIHVVIRLALSAVLIYLAVFAESKAAMATLLVLMTLANEVCAALVRLKRA